MIRQICVEDTSDIQALYERARLDPGGAWGLNWTPQQVAAECAASRGWVSEVSGRIEAFLLVQDLGDEKEILLLATDPPARGQGRMAELLRHLLSTGDKVWLEVHEANRPARQLYEKMGFLQVGERRRYYADGASAVLYNHG